MSEREVGSALEEARQKAVAGIPTNEIRDLMRSYWRGEKADPFDEVNLRIAAGELTTGDPLKDFIVMEHGMDRIEDLLAFYKILESEVRGRSGNLIASIQGLYGHLDPRRVAGSIEVGSIKDEGLRIDLQGGKVNDSGGKLVQVFPSLGVQTDYRFVYSFPHERSAQKPNFYLGGSVNLPAVNTIRTGSIHLESPQKIPQGRDVLIGSSAVSEWFSENKMEKVLRNMEERMPQNVKT